MEFIGANYPKKKYKLEVVELSDKEFLKSVYSDLLCLHTNNFDKFSTEEKQAYATALQFLKKRLE